MAKLKVIDRKYYKHLKKTAIWLERKWAGSGRLACTSSKTETLNKIVIQILILNFKVNSEKNERNNP